MEDILRRCLQVAPDSPTGLVWRDKVSKHSPITIGGVAGNFSPSGYCDVKVKGKSFRTHRVIYFLVHNVWPDQVDHIDGNKRNNHPDNLRDVSNLVNSHNRLGGNGYYKKGAGKFQAYITVCGFRKWLGVYSSAKEARAAHLAARAESYIDVPDITWKKLGLIQ